MKKFHKLWRKLRAHIGHGLRTGIELNSMRLNFPLLLSRSVVEWSAINWLVVVGSNPTWWGLVHFEFFNSEWKGFLWPLRVSNALPLSLFVCNSARLSFFSSWVLARLEHSSPPPNSTIMRIWCKTPSNSLWNLRFLLLTSILKRDTTFKWHQTSSKPSLCLTYLFLAPKQSQIVFSHGIASSIHRSRHSHTFKRLHQGKLREPM